MRILAVTPAQRGITPGQRFRIEQWERYLGREDITLQLEPFADDALQHVLYQPGHRIAKAAGMIEALFRRVTLARHSGEYDAIYLYREASLIGPAIAERRFARSGVPLIYDFDDPIWMPYRSPANGAFSALKFVGKTAEICRLADVVTVGNRLLGDYAKQYNDDVRVFPSTIDAHDYTPKTHTDKASVTVGWTGSHSTLPFLEPVKPVLREISRAGNTNVLIISHTDRLDWEGFTHLEARKWTAATEANDLHDMDIGIAPFPDSGWTPYRCHGKVLQYMAAGIPVIASPIGILPDFIEHGVNGFLASSNDEWRDIIAELARSTELRRIIGAAGRKTIEEKFSAETWAHQFAEMARSLT